MDLITCSRSTTLPPILKLVSHSEYMLVDGHCRRVVPRGGKIRNSVLHCFINLISVFTVNKSY